MGLKKVEASALCFCCNLPFCGRFSVNRGDSGVQIMGWYHRQFWEAAQDRYTKDKDTCQRLHAGIADYFMGRWSGGQKNNYYFFKSSFCGCTYTVDHSC